METLQSEWTAWPNPFENLKFQKSSVKLSSPPPPNFCTFGPLQSPERLPFCSPPSTEPSLTWTHPTWTITPSKQSPRLNSSHPQLNPHTIFIIYNLVSLSVSTKVKKIDYNGWKKDFVASKNSNIIINFYMIIIDLSSLLSTLTRKLGSFSFSPTSHKHRFYGLTSKFTRLIMKTKYVFHGLIYQHGNFHDNRTRWTVIFSMENCRWGGKGKRAGNSIIIDF